MKKELKKQIKEDQIAGGFELAWKWLAAHWHKLRIVAIAALVAALGMGGFRHFQSAREQAAAAALDAAIKLYETPVATELLPNQTPAGVTPFPSLAEKFKKAAAAFDGVERSYPTLATGIRARYYAALCRIELGDFTEAKKALETIAAGKQTWGLEASLARFALGALDVRIGAVDRAIETYRAMAEDETSAVPRDYALMTLATTLEDAKRLEEARASYRRLVERFPESVYAGEARRRAAYLAGLGRG